MHTLLSALKEIPAAARFFSNARSSTSIRVLGVVSADSNHKLPPTLSISPSTNDARRSVSCIPGRAIPVTEVYKWQQQSKLKRTPTETDPVERWLARRSAGAPPNKESSSGTASLRATDPEARCAAINRANSAHSTGPRTESGKQRSSLNALRHGLTARTAVLPTEDPDTYQRHIQQFLDEYAPATPTETQLVHEIATPPGVLTASHFSKPSCSPKPPIPKP